MGDILKFNYYYGIEAEQFSFYRVPRLLVKDERFKGLSSDAKLLYGLMLDRMALSMKNGWFDDENRAYIHYTIDNIIEDLGCAKEKGIKVLAELDSKKGIGLIEKIRQGLGKPDIIYVKNFATLDNADNSTEVRKSNFKKSENRTSGSSEIELQEVGKSNSSYNNTNYNNKSYNNHINPSDQEQEGVESDVSAYIEIIKRNIEYDYFMQYGEWKDRALYDELFEIICEVVCVKRKVIRIGGEDYPYELVKSKFLKLNSAHLQYVIECMQNTTTKIGNIKAYMITSLYNAPNTMNHYYQQEVKYDMYGERWSC